MPYCDRRKCSFGPNVSLYGAIHPFDPAKRRGLKGPEAGKEIHIEDDVWIAAGASILGGVRIGRGSTVGACSVVTKVSANLLYTFELDVCSDVHQLGCSPIPFCGWKSSQNHPTYRVFHGS